MNAILVLIAIQGFVGIAFLAFLVGVVITVFVLLGSGKATIRVQQIAPKPGHYVFKRLTCDRGYVWSRIKKEIDEGWEPYHQEESSGIGKYVVTLRRWE